MRPRVLQATSIYPYRTFENLALNSFGEHQLGDKTAGGLIRFNLNSTNRPLGAKNYELSNHLGNVLATVSDRKLWSGSTRIADVKSASDYYPFGMEIGDRTMSLAGYRYGFNEMEKDNEIKGKGNSYNFGARLQDPRLGRWLSVDPASFIYSSTTPYSFTLNSPLNNIDPTGAVVEPAIAPEFQKQYEAALSQISKDEIFARIYKKLDSSNERFRVYFLRDNLANIEFTKMANGSFTQARDTPFLFFWTNKGGIDVPHAIKFNGRIGRNGKYKGANPKTVAEEFFHAGQYLFYKDKGGQTSLSAETEVRVYRALVFYKQTKDISKSEIIDGYTAEKYVAAFANDKDVQKYFDALISGSEISEKQEKLFREKVKELAVTVYDKYSAGIEGWKPGEKLEDYSGDTKYFDSLTEKEK